MSKLQCTHTAGNEAGDTTLHSLIVMVKARNLMMYKLVLADEAIYNITVCHIPSKINTYVTTPDDVYEYLTTN